MFLLNYDFTIHISYPFLFLFHFLKETFVSSSLPLICHQCKKTILCQKEFFRQSPLFPFLASFFSFSILGLIWAFYLQMVFHWGDDNTLSVWLPCKVVDIKLRCFSACVLPSFLVCFVFLFLLLMVSVLLSIFSSLGLHFSVVHSPRETKWIIALYHGRTIVRGVERIMRWCYRKKEEGISGKLMRTIILLVFCPSKIYQVQNLPQKMFLWWTRIFFTNIFVRLSFSLD